MATNLLSKVASFIHDKRFWWKPRSIGLSRIDVSNISKDPIEQFGQWFKQASWRSWPRFAYFMNLSTIDARGFPNARTVGLMKFDSRGFEFNCARQTPKGKELSALPKAALTIFWEALNRQVRIQGTTHRLSDEESDAYFRSRPRDQQIFEWVQLHQSEKMTDPDDLMKEYRAYEQKFAGKEVPRPENFGGFRVVPERIEFLQFGLTWLSTDRFVYSKREDGTWEIQRLYP